MIVERRDQVFMTFLDDSRTAVATCFDTNLSTNGPFFTLRGMA
jgi:hypothetical protein